MTYAPCMNKVCPAYAYILLLRQVQSSPARRLQDHAAGFLSAHVGSPACCHASCSYLSQKRLCISCDASSPLPRATRYLDIPEKSIQLQRGSQICRASGPRPLHAHRGCAIMPCSFDPALRAHGHSLVLGFCRISRALLQGKGLQGLPVRGRGRFLRLALHACCQQLPQLQPAEQCPVSGIIVCQYSQLSSFGSCSS